MDGDGFGFTEVTQRDIRYLEVRKDITQSWAKGAARLEGATSFSYDVNGNLSFLDRGRKQGAGQNSVAFFEYDLEGQIIGRADKASALANAAFFAGYAADPDAIAASGDGESGFSYFNPSETQNVQRQLFGSAGGDSASTSLQSYLYANNKPISQASGNQALALKKLTLQGGQPIQAPFDPLTGEQAASTGARLLIEESDIARTAGVIDRTATARNIAARAYAGDPGFAQLSLAAQDKVAAYVLAQLPPDAELVAGAAVTLHSFILMVDASYNGLTQITDYSLRQLGSDGIPGGTVQSHVVRPGDTLQTIAQIYFGSPAYWYLIADANGLSGSEALTEGLTLTIPNQVANSANSAQTFKVYNESEVIGSTSPEIRTVAKKKKWYQKLIQILIIVILVVAAVFTAGVALGAAGVLTAAAPGLLGVAAGIGTGLSAVSVIAIGAAVYAGASIITQGLAVAAGLQESFSWKAVGKAAVTGAVSAGAAYFGASLTQGMDSFGAVATRVSVEAGKQIILDGKITNVAGLVGAAASGGAFKEMGESGSSLRAAGDLATKYGRSFGAGLSILENAARGRDNNALNWVSLATSAIFDAGDAQQSEAAGSQGNQGDYYEGMGSQYFDRAGNVNWTNVAVQAVGTVVISNRLGSDAAINYFGNVAGEAFVAGYANDDLRTKRELAALGASASPVIGNTTAEPKLSNSLTTLQQNLDEQIALMERQEFQDLPQYASLSTNGIGIPADRDFKQSDWVNKLKLKEVSQFLAETKKTLGGWTDDSNAFVAAAEEYYKNQASDKSNNFLVQNAAQALGIAVSAVGAGGVLNPLEMGGSILEGTQYAVESKSGLEELKKLGGIGPDNKFVREGLEKIIQTELKFADTVAQGLGKRFGLGKILDKLVDGNASFRGTIGELMTENALRMTGLFSEVSGSLSDKSWGIKNTSDNGIDIIVKPKYGAYAAKGGWYGYEVKTSQKDSPLALSGYQKKGADSFMRERIDNLAGDAGVFTKGRVSQSDVAMAQRIQREQGRMEYRGDVVQITNFGGKNVKVNINPWVSSALQLPGSRK